MQMIYVHCNCEKEKCSSCKGIGAMNESDYVKCDTCNGNGRINEPIS